ncbi:MAG: branched-chain amino acid ABC transporter permease [Lachnospiraceae bacterium]|nr:branched-chain amino acid ABC transporter permease [Lachnospiraceae bacterium]
MDNIKRKYSKKTISSFINYGIVIAFFLVLQILSVTGHLGSSMKGQLIPICSYIIMALSLNLVVGISGELSLGHAGFMSVGAFSGVVAASSLADAVPNGIIRLLIALMVGALFAGLAGMVIGIPVLRLQGDYLAIVTLAFGEIIKNVLNCLYVGADSKGLHFSLKDQQSLHMESSGKVILSGPMGALGITKLSTFFIGIVLIILVLFYIQNFVNSRPGRAIAAIRDNRIAAEACGIPVTKYKLMAFVTSAAMAGAAGALYALNYSTVVPKKFDFNTSILVLVFVVLGGIGNLRGSIIAATVLTILPELLREFQDYRMLVYAVVLILVMLITNNEKAMEYLRKTIKKLLKSKSEGRHTT